MANLLYKLASGLNKTRQISGVIDTLLGASDAAAARSAIEACPYLVGDERRSTLPLSPNPDGLFEDTNGWLWLPMEGQSFGSASSGADVATDGLEILYLAWWPHLNLGTPGYSISSVGVSAQADWDAGKAMSIPDNRGRTPVQIGQGAGLTDRALASHWGEEEHTLVEAELPEIQPVLQVEGASSGASETSGGGVLTSDRGPLGRRAPPDNGLDLDAAISSFGGDSPHNVTQPSYGARVLIFTGARA